MHKRLFQYLLVFGSFCVSFCGVAQVKDSLHTAATQSHLEKQTVQESSMVSEKEVVPNTPSVPDSLSFTIPENGASYELMDYALAAKFDSLWMKEFIDSKPLFYDMQKQIQAIDTEMPVAAIAEISTDTLKARLKRLNDRTPFNIVYNPALERVIKSFLSKKNGLMQRMLTLSQFYFPMFEEQLDNHAIPLEIKYLAIVESALNPQAKSRVGATGLWQFMYGTGREMKLSINSYVDERSDPIKSTKAACSYLKRLYSIYNDWDLALAAYNSGPGNVNKAIRRSGGYKNYWNIRSFLPRETAGYVPAFIATMYVFEYAEEHGLTAQKAAHSYFETDTVHVKSLITFDQISKFVGIEKEELRLLNPSYKLDVIPFVEDRPYALRLPVYKIGKFVSNEKEIYAFVEKEFKSKESPLPEIVKRAQQNSIRYSVRSGDFLGKIAERYGVRVSQIKQWNGLRSNNLKIGQRLTIYPRKHQVAAVAPKKTPSKRALNANAKVHEVQEGDSLWTISRKYPGITIEDLRKWNGISGNNLKLGAKLKLCDCSS